MASQEGKKMYEILNPDQDVEGKSVSEWTAEWWKWVGERSADQSPLDDTTGEFACLGNDGEVFFVAGPRVVTIDPGSDPPDVDDGIVQRTFEVPYDTPILVPIMNVMSFNTKKDPLEFYTERFEDLYATIDGKEIKDIQNYKVLSGYFELGPAEEGTVLYDLITNDSVAKNPNRTYDARSDGYWLMVDDLSKGKHTLEFGGFFDWNNDGVFNTLDGDVQMAAKDIITVVKPEEYTCPFDAETLPEAEMLIA
jgi:hypothetical protein